MNLTLQCELILELFYKPRFYGSHPRMTTDDFGVLSHIRLCLLVRIQLGRTTAASHIDVLKKHVRVVQSSTRVTKILVQGKAARRALFLVFCGPRESLGLIPQVPICDSNVALLCFKYPV